MTAADVIAHARAGELSNLTSTGFNDEKILTYINLGLIELHKRFRLDSGEAIVTMRDNKTIYTMDENDPDVNMDRPGLMYILEVYDENGSLLNLNVEDDPLSILTPSYNTIQVPYPAEGDVLSVMYVPEPKKINTVNDIVEIPPTLLEALLHYIGYRAHGSIDGNIAAENSTHYQRFESSCIKVGLLGVVSQDDMLSYSTQSKGFV